ncbi:MAG: hypothetical protein Kow0037_18310 [Calditrichia bacterium]
MKKITYTYKLKTPVLISDFNGDTNTRHSLEHIPGTVLLGIVAGWLDRRQITVSDLDIAKLVQTNQISFGDAVISHNHHPAWPVPMGLYGKKGGMTFPEFEGKGNTGESELLGMYKDDHTLPSGEPWKAVPNGWLQMVNNTPHRVIVKKTTQTHNSIVPELGKPDKEEGGVFVYEALKEGQKFTGEILFEDDNLAKGFYNAVKNIQEVMIGKSLAAEYGRAEIQWQEPVEIGTESANPQELHLVLISDAILYDGQGMPTTELTADWLQNWLREKRMSDIEVKPLNGWVNYFKNRLVPGFNGKWGQFRQTVPAITRGSVFHFSFNGERAEEAVREILCKGIGERRNEGFGRVSAAHPIWQFTDILEGRQKAFIRQTPSEQEEKKYTKWHQITEMPAAVEKAVFMRQVGVKVAEKLNEILFNKGKLKDSFENHPSNSQLQGLRNKALIAQGVDDICRFMQAKVKKKADRDGYWNAKLNYDSGTVSLFDLFREKIADGDWFFRFLELDGLYGKYQKYYTDAVKLFVNQFVGTLIKARDNKKGGRS